MPPPEGGGSAWDARIDELGAALPATPCWRSSRPTASRSRCACRSRADRDAGRRAHRGRAVGAPLEPGLACLTAHDHARLQLAAQLPGPRRPRRGRRLGLRRTSSSAASSCRRARATGRLASERSGASPARDARAPGADAACPAQGLTVAVTGPTGDIGKPFIRALERSREVGRIVGMARRPFDPAAQGWRRPSTASGDVLDRASVDALVEGADVVVHLAFIILGRPSESATSTSRARATSSRPRSPPARSGSSTPRRSPPTASPTTPQPLTEDVPPRGSDRFSYSAHKAELEDLLADVLSGGDTDAYVFRPCIVAGPEATA